LSYVYFNFISIVIIFGQSEFTVLLISNLCVHYFWIVFPVDTSQHHLCNWKKQM